VFYLCLFNVKLHEDGLKKIETSRSVSGLYVTVYFNSCAFVGVSVLNFKRRIKSHLPFSDIIRSSPYSPRFQDKG